ncbi:MAG: hypothetical protein EBT04_14115 [Betaproteobacteria bacterium]|nr:hypothetical protein [Betaproteobacteria bacterium]
MYGQTVLPLKISKAYLPVSIPWSLPMPMDVKPILAPNCPNPTLPFLLLLQPPTCFVLVKVQELLIYL